MCITFVDTGFKLFCHIMTLKYGKIMRDSFLGTVVAGFFGLVCCILTTSLMLLFAIPLGESFRDKNFYSLSPISNEERGIIRASRET